MLISGLLILWTVLHARRRWRRTPMAVAVYACVLAFVGEVVVGAAQVLLQLPTALRAAHLALASVVWAAVVLMASAYWLDTRAQAAEEPAQATALREAAARW